MLSPSHRSTRHLPLAQRLAGHLSPLTTTVCTHPMPPKSGRMVLAPRLSYSLGMWRCVQPPYEPSKKIRTTLCVILLFCPTFVPPFLAQGDDGTAIDHPRPDDPHGDSATAGSIRAEGAQAPSPPAPSRRKRYWPTLARWREASWTALKDPGTWAPAAGAAVVGF